MDWGILLTGIVFVVMVALMIVIGSLDRRSAQHQKQQILIADQEVEGATSHCVCSSEV